jgi:hypothetical protein
LKNVMSARDTTMQNGPEQPVDEAFVRDAYRVLLGREAEDAKLVQAQVTMRVPRAQLVSQMIRSLEFSLSPVAKRLKEEHWDLEFARRAAACDGVAGQFAQKNVQPEDGFYKDFLGVRTRCTYIPGLEGASGHVFGLPGQGQAIRFDPSEWEGTLRSVLEAKKGRVVAFELGAGWAPWLVTVAAAARIKGVRDVKLVGVEADDGHYAMMEQHLRDNGVDPAAHTLLKGIIGVSDGVAYFPKLPDTRMDWGAQAVLDANAKASTEGFQDYRGKAFDELEEMPSFALSTLLREFDRVDIIHCDIQNGEVEVVPAAFEEIDKRVRRFMLGTHSREAEAIGLAHFAKAGWILEAETPCQFYAADGRVVAHTDGVQVWTNPKLA